MKSHGKIHLMNAYRMHCSCMRSIREPLEDKSIIRLNGFPDFDKSITNESSYSVNRIRKTLAKTDLLCKDNKKEMRVFVIVNYVQSDSWNERRG